MSDRLSYEEKKELPDSVFGLPERREYPMPDAAHVKAAEAYFRYCPEELKPKLARAILARAREYGVDVESPTRNKQIHLPSQKSIAHLHAFYLQVCNYRVCFVN